VYFGYVDMGNGNIEVRSFTIATGVVSSAFVLHAALQVDNHAAPSFYIRPDNKLLAVYFAHDDTVIRTRVTTNVLPDISAWEAEDTFDPGGTVYTYPTIFAVGSTLWLFYRDWQGGDMGVMCYVTSTDDGDTWTGQTELYKSQDRSSYWMVTTDGTRIDIATTDGRNPPDSGDVPIYHFYRSGGSWRQSDGTVITGLPFVPADLTEVYDSSDGMGWPQGITYNDEGNPAFVYAVLDVPTSNSYRRAEWSGSAWVLTIIGDSDGVIEAQFAGNVILGYLDADRAYFAVKIAGRWEMWTWTWNGSTWEGAALTVGSSVDHISPAQIIDNDGRYRVVWLTGTYTDYLDNDTGVTAGR
jgi:hypothetical protein